jgi:hypothetical protein
MATCQEDNALTKKLNNAVKTLFMDFFLKKKFMPWFAWKTIAGLAIAYSWDCGLEQSLEFFF